MTKSLLLDHPVHVSPELSVKAKLLRESSCFSATFIVGANSLIEKQQVFLTLAGLKPLSQVEAAHWVGDPTQLETTADDPDTVGSLLNKLGLAHHLSGDDKVTMAVVAKDASLIDQFLQTSHDDDQKIGKLLGYPATAIEAAACHDWRDDENEILEASGLSGFPFFRLSRDHYTEELSVIRQWQQVLQAYGLT